MSEQQLNLGSVWQKVDFPNFPALQEDIEVDVAIAGGGLTGITTAYLLTEAGKKVAVLDATKIGGGTTGHTTAKITAQHDVIYHELLSHIGKEQTKLYYKAQDEAISWMRNLVNNHNIECDFHDEDHYLYATTHHGEHKLKRELEAYKQLDIPGEWLTSLPISLEIRAALKLRGQARFHPLHYMAYLCQKISEKGGLIYENTVCEKVVQGNDKRPAIQTRGGATVTAKKVVSATHFPFVDGGGLYMTRLRADRSYVIAGTCSKPWPGGMYLSVDQTSRSLRSATINGEEMILVGGEGHKAGQGMNALKHYDAIKQFATKTLEGFTQEEQWSAQDLITLDKLPYIGELSALRPDVLIATGFRKWGMTNSAVAAHVLCDLIVDGNSLYSQLFKPSRFHADPSIRSFLKENADVAKHLIRGKLHQDIEHVEELEAGEGAVIDKDGERVGAYRDKDGTLHLVDTTCTHMGCEVNWNHADNTWDCPCHGSRFSYTGDVIEGPAKKPLGKKE
ncbi:FAD-dependent oxidoreductase [Shouchella clausii]|uniref:FAD-dependent oxidoreductase n=1 Tax=Shouchella clausii TaxID=79880 RepID=UPI0031FCE7B8